MNTVKLQIQDQTYTESQAFFGGLIQRGRGEGGGGYIRNHFYVSRFSRLLLASQERGME